VSLWGERRDISERKRNLIRCGCKYRYHFSQVVRGDTQPSSGPLTSVTGIHFPLPEEV